jgi:hypothetical protein
MRHVREVDGNEHTVLMAQVENEVGLLGLSRDHSPAAEQAWNETVPVDLIKSLRDSSSQPKTAPRASGSGIAAPKTWAETFGTSDRADEIFMAWQYARYVDAVAAAGKRQYAIPMYVNAWLVQSPTQAPGAYPSGGPVLARTGA